MAVSFWILAAQRPDVETWAVRGMRNPSRSLAVPLILHSMQETAAASSSMTAGSFASLLATFAGPSPTVPDGRGKADRAPDWNEDGLDDDVATLSYEQALRTQTRYRLPRGGDLPRQQDDGTLQRKRSLSTSKLTTTAELSSTPGGDNAQALGTGSSDSAPLSESRKAASITIRLSKAECAQLHQRASEAGLTVSAYLRSCTLEVEALRAQVKEALSQLRLLPSTDEQEPASPAHSHTHGWWPRLVLRWMLRCGHRRV